MQDGHGQLETEARRDRGETLVRLESGLD